MPAGRLLRLAVLGGAATILLAQIVANLLLGARAHRAAEASAQAVADGVARSVVAALNRGLLQVDALLLSLPVLLAPFLREGTLDAAGTNRLLRELANQNFAYRDILLVGPDGQPLATALAASRRRPLILPIGPDYAQVGGTGSGPRFGGPVRNPLTGEWSVFVLRAIEPPGLGPLAAVAELPVPVLGALLAAGGEPPGLRVKLQRADGRLLASLPHDEARIGERLGPPPEGRSRLDGAAAFVAERPTLYPGLVVSVGLAREAAMAGWVAERDRAILVSAALGLLVAALAAALLLVLRQRARAEAERLRWRATLESALDSMSDGFVMFDANDRLVICNRRYREFYARSAPFIREGARFADIIRGGLAAGQYPQFQGDADRFIAELVARRRASLEPIERLLPDGRWILITERPTPEGGTVGIRTEITALKRATEAAEQAVRAKDMFLARMSHELRTPLNAILGYTQLLLSDRALSAQQHERLRMVHEAGAHLIELVNGLLDLSKMEAGRLSLERAPVALDALLRGCIAFLMPEAQRKGILLRLDAGAALPCAVLGDATRLRQMILNLLANAVTFTPQGGSVTLRAGWDAAGLTLAVEDSGPGVPEAQRHLLFRDFTQLDTPRDAGSQGSGLGLAITARLAALMGGSIGVETAPGGGALFRLVLPLGPAALPRRHAAAEDGPLAPLSLLVADDVAPNRLLLHAMLTAAGHRVELAADGAEALALLARGGFDAALLDVRMPGMDGLEATRRLRALPPPLSRLPVIAVTASAMPEEVAECRAAGMDAHVAKPVERQALFAVLRRLVPGCGAPERLGAALLDELGEAAPGLIAAFREELAAVAAELAAPAAAQAEALRALLHRGLGAAGNLRLAALVALFEDGQRRLHAGRAPAALAREVAAALAGALAGLDPAPAERAA